MPAGSSKRVRKRWNYMQQVSYKSAPSVLF